MDFYVINLDGDVQRLSWMDRQFQTMGLSYRRFPAVHGAGVAGADLDYHRDARRAHLSASEIGCLLSHIGVWRAIAAGGAEAAVVLEDDVHFAPDFAGFVTRIQLDPGEFCIHKLETLQARITVAHAPAFRIGTRAAYKMHTNHGGSAAYLISRGAAARLLDQRGRFTAAIDTELFDFARRATRDLTVYQWTPAPCVQDFLLANKEGRLNFQSSMQDRSDVRAGILKGSKPLIRAFKNLMRPVYTQAYSVVLRGQGQRRIDVKFG